MKLSTRLLLPLLATVAIIMTAYAMWALRQREITLTAEARRETQAYAVALELAMQSAFRDPQLRDVQHIIDRISRERTIYGVLVYGVDGGSLFFSDPLRGAIGAPADSVRLVLETGTSIALEREIGGQQVYSVLRPVRDTADRVVGAFEVAQTLAFLRAEQARTRQRFLLNTVTLLAAVTVVILLLVRRLIAEPLERFVAAARALGRGELTHRIDPQPGGGELSDLADEFNRMASHLETARTDLVRQADERIALERRLRETEKLAAVGNLAAGLAHEIGAPLHVIRGRAEMLFRHAVEEKQQRNLRIIVEQIGRITLIVRNLLDFSRRRELRLDLIDLASVARGAAELLDGEFEKTGVAFQWHGEEPVWIHGDGNLLHQVFVNLFINAIQAMEMTENGGREINCTVAPPTGRPDTGDRHAAPGTVAIEVRDTGPGVAEDALPKIFDPFFTTKPGGIGTGLGLAVARSIVEEHGGSLEVANDTAGARGAVFRLTLPAGEAPGMADA